MPTVKPGLVVQKRKNKTKKSELSVKSVQQLDNLKPKFSFIVEYVDTLCVLNTRCPNSNCIEKCQLELAGWVND